MEIVKITKDNLFLVKEFLRNELSPFFIYYQNHNIEECFQNHLLTIIGIVDQRPVAYGHLNQEDRCWLGICVLKDFQGRGFGKDIMNYLLNNYQGKELWLSVDSSNEVAIKLYLSYNFQLKEIHQKKLKMRLSL